MGFLINPFIYAVAPGGCSGSVISTSNLVGYYKLDNNSIDSSGNGLTLTNYNNAVVYGTSTSKYSEAGIFLTGTTDPTSSRRALTISSTTSFPNTNSTSASATYMGWFNFDNLPSTSEIYLWSLARSGQRAVTLTYQSSNNLRIQIFDGSSGYQTDYSWTPSTDTWYHIAVTQSAGLFTIYINGVSSHTWTNTNNGNGGGNIFRLGGHEGFNLSMLGWIDDFSVYSRVLSASEIQDVYESTCPLDSDCPSNLISTTSLAAYYKLDGNGNDSSGNGYTMTNTNVYFTSSISKFGQSAIFLTGSTLPSTSSARLVNTTTAIIPDSDSTNTNGYSISCWVNIESLPSTQYATVFYFKTTGDRFVTLRYMAPNESVTGNYGWDVNIYDGSSNRYTWTKTESTNTWIHISFVMQPTTGAFKVYFDGVERISATETGNGYIGSQTFVIGNLDISLANRAWIGYIDDFNVFNRPLTTSEIQGLYTSTCPLKS